MHLSTFYSLSTLFSVTYFIIAFIDRALLYVIIKITFTLCAMHWEELKYNRIDYIDDYINTLSTWCDYIIKALSTG